MMEIIGGRGPYINCLVKMNFFVFLVRSKLNSKNLLRLKKMQIEVNMTI